MLDLGPSRLMRLRAAGGDLVVATTAGAAAMHDENRESAMADGGPAIFELLCSHRSAASTAAGFIAEVL
jgi:hypothetical protein